MDPRDDRVVYIGTEPVCLYRSEDKGDTWEELKNLLDLPDEVKRHWKSPQPEYQGHVRHIFIDPDDPQILYLSIEHGGIVRTFDGGKTWEDVSKGIDYLDIQKISNDPVRKDLYFMTSAKGFFHSTDPAQGWTRIENHGITRDYFHDFMFLPGQLPAMLIATAKWISRKLESSGHSSVRDFSQS